jgi:hypothetical protein
MRTFKNVTRTLPEPDTIICNKCGETLHLNSKDFEPWLIDSFLRVFHEFGYGTSTDGESVSFDLCPNCVEEFIKTFKIPAERIKNYG